MHTHRTQVIVLGALLVVVLSLGSAAADAQGLREVTLQIDGAAVPYYGPLYVADAKGFFAEEGLKVRFLYGAASDIVKNVAAGNVEFGFPNADAVITARASGVPVTVVHTTLQHGLGATIFKSDRGISTPADLQGKRVAITSYGSPNYVQLQVLLKQAGLELNDINLQIVGTGAIVNALVTDQVDAIVFSMLRTFELRYSGVDVAEFRSDDFLPSHGNVIVVGDAFAQAEPETIRAFLRAVNKGLQFFIDGNVREGVEISIANHTPTYEGREDYLEQVLTDVYAGYLWQSEETRRNGLGWADLDRWNTSTQVLQEYGILNAPLEAETFVTNAYLE